MATQFGFPFHIDERGRTGGDDDAHLVELIEQLLFTSPGERVNRPEFGTGLAELVFVAGREELVGAIKFRVEAALQQWLGERIRIHGVEVLADDATLHITLRYSPRGHEDERVVRFARELR